MKRKSLFYLVCIFILMSCDSYSKIEIASEAGNNDRVDITAVGKKKVKEYHNVQLPFKMIVRNSNLPLRVSIVSKEYFYEDFSIERTYRDAEETTTGKIGLSMTAAGGAGGLLCAFLSMPEISSAGISTMAVGLPLYLSVPNYIPSQKSYELKANKITSENAFMALPNWYRFSEIVDVYKLLGSTGYNSKENYKVAKTKVNYLMKQGDSGDLYYQRGICNYKLKKYRQATKDFKKALVSNDLDQETKEDVRWYIDNIQERKSESAERRSEMWTNILGGALQVTSNALALSSAIRGNYQMTADNGAGGLLSMSDAEFNNYTTQQLSLLAQQSAFQTQQENFAEYNKWNEAQKRITGKDISYQEFCMQQGQALQELKEEGVDMNFNPKQETITDSQTTSNASAKKKDIIDSIDNDDSEENLNDLIQPNNKKNGSDKVRNKSYQQFHSGTVSDSDYTFDKKITLYRRDGDKAKVMMPNVELYKKGAHKYVKIGNKYYSVGYSNWLRFRRGIGYGHTMLYFND